MNESKVKKLVVSAMFAAICCVATMIIRIPTVVTQGYVNIGDVAVLSCGWYIGGVYGALAAGIGSALADILASAAMYAPGTFVIKAAMALVAYVGVKMCKKAKMPTNVAYAVSALVAEIIMVAGYFVYESVILGYGMAAAGAIAGNVFQGTACIVLSIIFSVAMELSGAAKKIRQV